MTFCFAACGGKSNDNKDSSIGYGSNSENGSMNNNDSGMGSDIKSDINSGMSEVESFTESTIDGVTGNSSNDNGSGTNSNKNDNTHTAQPMGKRTPKQDGFGQNFNVRQNRRTCSCKSRTAFKECINK